MLDLKNRRVTVAGLGRFGGGIAVTQWLVGQGARVLVTDRDPAEKLSGSLDQLRGLDVQTVLGEHREKDFTDTDLVVASPAIAPNNPYLQAANTAGVPVSTEIKLFVERCIAPIIAVTGTKGKSTTTAMLGRIVARKFTTWTGGNIGKSLLADLPSIKSDHRVVLELSSYMLEHLRSLNWSPQVALITMLAPDHLEWHGGYEGYIAAKSVIVRNQQPADVAISGYGDEEAAKMIALSPGRKMLFDTPGCKPFSLRLPGAHNQRNAQAAYTAASALGLSWEDAQEAMSDFVGLPHRLQLVHESAGVRWYNDSIATIPQAAAAAMGAFEAGHVIQIVGGYDKHLDMSPMTTALAHRAKAALCIGTIGPKLAQALRDEHGTCQVHECGDLDTAVATAKKIATNGDVVLLSTGCASYDQFVNFEQRGDKFAELARRG